MIVDDNETNLALLESSCSGCGACTSTLPEAAREALWLIDEAQRDDAPFELAIVDYQMPEMHGGELIRRIRESLGPRELPIVLLASLDRIADSGRARAGQRGAGRSRFDRSELHRAIASGAGRSGPGARRERSDRPRRDSPMTDDEPTHPAAPRSRARKRRLLVAEDNPINQTVMVEMLHELGFEADVVRERARRARGRRSAAITRWC